MLTPTEKLNESLVFVKATDNEQFYFWKEANWLYTDPNDDLWHHDGKLLGRYVQDGLGCTQVIGYVGGDTEKPVNLCFSFALIMGYRVCFYETISRYNDTEMVEQWITKEFPVGGEGIARQKLVRAADFDLTVQFCKNLYINQH